MASSPSDPKTRLAEFWDLNRDYYAQAQAANVQVSPERAVLFSYLQPGWTVVDLGCGSCENALWMPAGVRYVGFDVSTSALAMARELGRPVAARVRADGELLPFATGSVDAVISTWAFEHFHDPGKTFLEAARIVRPGGLLAVVGSTWDLPWELPPSLDPKRRLEVAAKRLLRQITSLVDGRHRFDRVIEPRVLTEGYVPDADAVHVTQSYLLARFLKAAGLTIVEHRALPHRADPRGARGLLRRALRAVPLWRRGWGNSLIVARRGERLVEPAYRLLPL